MKLILRIIPFLKTIGKYAGVVIALMTAIEVFSTELEKLNPKEEENE